MTANNCEVGTWNKKLVMRTINRHQQISQVQLVRETGLSPGTVTNIIKKLRKEGFIQDIGSSVSTGGRKPVIFRFNTHARYVGCMIFFDVHEVRIGILDLAGNVLKESCFAVATTDIDILLQNASEALEKLISELPVAREAIIANCAVFEGIVDSEAGILVYFARSGWRNIPVREKLEKLSNFTTFVEGFTQAKTLGEYWFGAAKGFENIVSILVDVGIGAAIIVNNRIYHGANYMEGEIGHTVVAPNGPLCKCGKKGCLETVASGPAMISRITELRESYNTVLPREVEKASSREAISMIFQAAENGDSLASRVVQDAGCHMGEAIAQLVNYFDPQCIMLVGYVIEEDTGIFTKIIRERCKQLRVSPEFRETNIVRGKLGRKDVLLGSAIPAYQAFFGPLTQHENMRDVVWQGGAVKRAERNHFILSKGYAVAGAV
ncbi:MAG: ROK family protein [Candidatus Omnitrophota bacterium]